MPILAPFRAYLKVGGVITYAGVLENQGVFWELVSVDPDTEEEQVPRGWLRYMRTKTDESCTSVNVYNSPRSATAAKQRYGTGRKYGYLHVKYGNNADILNNSDRVKVRVGSLG